MQPNALRMPSRYACGRTKQPPTLAEHSGRAKWVKLSPRAYDRIIGKSLSPFRGADDGPHRSTRRSHDIYDHVLHHLRPAGGAVVDGDGLSIVDGDHLHP